MTLTKIVAPVSEQQALLDSLNTYGIEAVKDSTGFYYSINNPGSDLKPKDACTAIAAFFKGSFFNGQTFDSTSTQPFIFNLYQMIPGWQQSLGRVGKGGSITLYIPPSLAYGAKDVTNPSTGQVVIPANSYLVFQVSIADLQ